MFRTGRSTYQQVGSPLCLAVLALGACVVCLLLSGRFGGPTSRHPGRPLSPDDGMPEGEASSAGTASRLKSKLRKSQKREAQLKAQVAALQRKLREANTAAESASSDTSSSEGGGEGEREGEREKITHPPRTRRRHASDDDAEGERAAADDSGSSSSSRAERRSIRKKRGRREHRGDAEGAEEAGDVHPTHHRRRRREEGEEEEEEGVRLPTSASTKHYLTIAIPTVHRPGKAYLKSALKALASQIEGTRWDSPSGVRVCVMNMKGGSHPLFESLQRQYRGKGWVEFHEVAEGEGYPVDPEGGFPTVHPMRRQERPGERVKRQSLDVAKLLEAVEGRSRYTLLYEDDFEMCPNGMLAIEYMIEKANRYSSDWAGIRCSFGLAGIVLHNSDPHQDVGAFAKYLKRHYARRPPDHLVVEWYAGEIDESSEYFGHSRPVMAFRHNLLHHIGEQSTLRAAKPWAFPGCFAELVAPQVFPVEAWNAKDCPDDDLWPCDRRLPSQIQWGGGAAPGGS